MGSVPLLSLNKPASTNQGSGPILSQEEKERRAQEEKRILERMRALTKNNPGLGFEDMFWGVLPPQYLLIPKQ